jgi:hypothetical protein
MVSYKNTILGVPMLSSLQSSKSKFQIFIKNISGTRFLIIYCDISVDCDDLKAVILAAHQKGWIVLIITCGADPLMKARYAKGVVNCLQANDSIFVVPGTNCNVPDKLENHQWQNLPEGFMLAEESELELDVNWLSIVQQFLTLSPANKTSVIGIGPMSDMTTTMYQLSELFSEAVSEVIIQAGVLTTGDKVRIEDKWTFLLQNNAANNAFDPVASSGLYPYLFSNSARFRTYVCTRVAATKVSWSFGDYNTLLQDTQDSPLAATFIEKQIPGLRSLWQKCHNVDRGSLPLDRTPLWFNDFFCKNSMPPEAMVLGGNSIDPAPYIQTLNPYDALTAMLAVSLHGEGLPPVDELFNFYQQEGFNNLYIMGLCEDETGLKNPALVKSEMIKLMTRNLNYRRLT